MPVACALRDRFPGAFIAWVVEQTSAPLVALHTSLDHVLVLPRGWWKSPSQVCAIRRQLRELRIDVTLDVQSLSKSSLAAWLSGARHRIGFRGALGREASPWLNNDLVTPTAAHVVDCFLEILRPLGIERPEIRYDVPRDPAAISSVANLLHWAHIESDFVLVNPGAAWAAKRWPPQRFAEVINYLGQTRRLTSMVVWEGPQGRQLAEEVLSHAPRNAVLAPPISLPELAELLRQACMYVGNDTGPTHLAAAVGTPCVSLHGPTRRERCGPYGRGHVALQTVFEPVTHRQRGVGNNSAMRAIEVSDVCQACDQILNQQPSILSIDAHSVQLGDESQSFRRAA